MAVSLYKHQEEAIKKMTNGCILCGGVGSGKSRASLAYFFIQQGGDLKAVRKKKITKKLLIITTARKRDDKEWEQELIPFGITAVIDSWNNIKKYTDVKDAFFIFDEQRVVGWGTWSKSFVKIAKNNSWILLSATPGDTWMDYVPVFIANGFYKNPTQFKYEHVIYSRFSKFPKIDRYIGTKKLEYYRSKLLIEMDFDRKTLSHHIDILVEYNKEEYKKLNKDRFDVEKNRPIKNASELCIGLRKIVNMDISRIQAIKTILKEKHRVIIFYNFDYELELIKKQKWDVPVTEWNGHKHEQIPETDSWIYLVQYNAGAEGWNCIKTDTMVYYSANYSYKMMEQARGRIDRLNTPYIDLYFYHLKSSAPIDIAIARAIKEKKKFNERKFAGF